jgi:hypothetical protein
MNWYKFLSLEAFNAWHDALKIELGYPLPSVDSQGNVIGDPYTTEYTSVLKVSPNDWRTISAPEYAEGLEPSSKPIFPHEPVINGDSEAL